MTTGVERTEAIVDAVPALEISDLQVRFETARGPLRAVDGVSLEVPAAQSLGVVGESGSGKSVLVRAAMQLLPGSAQVAGEVRISGRDVVHATRRELRHFWGPEVSMVFQDPMTSLNPVKRVGTQLTEGLRYHLKLGRNEARDRAVTLLRQVGIPEPERRLRQYPHELSGGMRQRVMIAIALSCEPQLLIADEPTTALDVTVQRQILDLLSSVQQERQMAMILITHDLGVVAGHTKRVAVMYAGQIVELADTVDLFQRVRHPYSEALLRSIPTTSRDTHARLPTISGRPPDMVRPPGGCRFAARCAYAQQRCIEEMPPLMDDGTGHHFRCFFPVGTDKGVDAVNRNLSTGHTAARLDLRAPAVE